MLNYEVEPERLMPLVPKGTELDTHDGKTFVSMVGFLFLNTRVMGLAIPFHRDFEEINLRFYVRRKAEDGWRRGVVFVHWGYTSQKDGGTIEYQVEHPPWRIWQAQSGRLTCDVEKLYGQRFVGALSAQPSSVFRAEGSEIQVYKGRRLI
jgi:uncharacterized protein YqjF (DUF2071 family)